MNSPRLPLPLLLVLLLSTAAGARAAVPAPEQLLPPDTLAVLTVPDWEVAARQSALQPAVQLLDDPSMRTLVERVKEKIAGGLTVTTDSGRKVGLPKLTDHLKGQLTLAVTRNGLKPGQPGEPGIVILLDARDRGDALRKEMDGFLKQLADAGEKIKPEPVQGVEFQTLFFKSARTDDDGEKKEGKLLIGQSGSLLMLGNGVAVLDAVMARLKGGSAATLGEQALYQKNHARFFRNSIFHGWVNVRALMDLVTGQLDKPAGEGAQGLFNLRPDRVIEALGLNSLTTLAFNTDARGDGTQMEFFVGAPADARKGIVKLLAPAAKPAGPLPFVGAEVVRFNRWRISGEQVFNSLEQMLTEAVPPVGGMISLMLDNAGKDKNPNFDLRRQLIGNLGDDLITIEKAPRGDTLADFEKTPSLFLVSSGNPDTLLDAVRTAMSGMSGSRGTEEDFLGQVIVSLPVMPMLPLGMPAGQLPQLGKLHLASSRGYVAFSSDRAMVEEFLRGGPGKDQSLPGVGGLNAAAERVGGFNTGWFGYENPREIVRILLRALARNPDLWTQLVDSKLPKAGGAAAVTAPAFFKELAEFVKLLPPFEAVEKYLHYSVYSASAEADGISFKVYAPVPPAGRK